MLTPRQRALLQGRRLYAPLGISGRVRRATKAQRLAIPDSVVDNFEDADANPPGVYEDGESISDYYSGDTEEFSRTTTDAIEGGHSLNITNSQFWERIYSFPGDGLPRYPEKGEKISALLRDDGGESEPGFMYGFEDDDGTLKGYSAEIGTRENAVVIRRIDDLNGESQTILLDDDVGTISANTIYELEVQWHDGSGSESDGTHEYTLYTVDQDLERDTEVGSGSTTDTNHDGRGVGWGGFNSSTDEGTGDLLQVLGSVD